MVILFLVVTVKALEFGEIELVSAAGVCKLLCR